MYAIPVEGFFLNPQILFEQYILILHLKTDFGIQFQSLFVIQYVLERELKWSEAVLWFCECLPENLNSSTVLQLKKSLLQVFNTFYLLDWFIHLLNGHIGLKQCSWEKVYVCVLDDVSPLLCER